MPNVGPMELLIVALVALLVLGPKRLPELGRSLGSGMREFKDGISGVRSAVEPDGEESGIESRSTEG